MSNPFKFLDAYSLQDKDVFFDKKEATAVFLELVIKSRLVLVYAK